jgi:hypothetical protein
MVAVLGPSPGSNSTPRRPKVRNLNLEQFELPQLLTMLELHALALEDETETPEDELETLWSLLAEIEKRRVLEMGARLVTVGVA